MIEALRSVRYGVADLALAEPWYSHLLDVQPYQRTDSVLRYCVNGAWLELVEVPGASGGASPASVLIHWGVDSLAQELQRLQALGIRPQTPPALLEAATSSNSDVRTAAFVDPFGRTVGLVEIHDPDVQRARAHRAAEKIALRNVRTALDDLGAEDRQQRKATRVVLALVVPIVLCLFGGLFLLKKILPQQPPPEERIVIPLSGKK